MPSTVPTIEEFQALEARVAALENAAPVPPEPEPPNGEGIQAKQIGNLIEVFGVNTFSSLDPDANVWGSWPADYSPPSVTDALRFCFPPECGFTPRLREYHYEGRAQMQISWLQQLRAALPRLATTICVGANGDEGDVATMLEMQADGALGINWLEGLNEPNTDFGSGQVPIETTMGIQAALTGADGIMGPSIVAGTPNPEGWIEGYCGDQLPALNGMMDYGNGHYYPPHCPDVPNTGYSINEYVGGLWSAYGHHPIHLTEFHPTLYAAGTLAIKRRIAFLAGRLKGHEPPIPVFRANAERDAYYTLMTLLRCAKNGALGLWWYALFDYGTTYECGLFPIRHAEQPRQSAQALRNLCLICADPRASAGFTPGRLALSVDPIPAYCDWDLYQASDGRYLMALWNAQEDAGGLPVDMTVGFATPPASVVEYDPLRSDTEIASAIRPASYTCALPGGVRILEVRV